MQKISGSYADGTITPSSLPATFSRGFAEFATHSLPQKIHEAMVITHCGQKLAGHISRDANRH